MLSTAIGFPSCGMQDPASEQGVSVPCWRYLRDVMTSE
jgi:hypothetical protein